MNARVGGKSARRRIQRPAGAPSTFACPRCDIVLWDGVDYAWCPACSTTVDWVDLDQPLWCCAGCDAFVNEPRAEWPRCAPCAAPMAQVHVHERPCTPRTAPSRLGRTAGIVWFAMPLAQLVVLALDPLGRVYVAPLFVLAVVAALGLVITILGGLGELRALARDRVNRVVHGLEHATIKLLDASGVATFGGHTHDRCFEVTLRNDGLASIDAVRTAVRRAIRRVARGEHALAYDRRCGTSLLVALGVAAVVVLAGTTLGLVLGAGTGPVIAATIVAAALGFVASRPLGMAAQRAWTVSTDFQDARVAGITRAASADGNTAVFLVHLAVR